MVGGGPYWPAETNPYNLYNPSFQNDDFVPYVQGPASAHVVWKQQFAIGGLMGGRFGQESAWQLHDAHPTIIYQGRCYRTVSKPFAGATQNVWECYDLRTGEIIWERTGVNNPTFVTYEEGIPTVPGSTEFSRNVYLGYIGGGYLTKYNPWNGAVVANTSISPITSATLFADPYALSVQSMGGGNYRLINWSIAGTSTNFTSRIVSNISWPFSSLGSAADFQTGIAISTTNFTPTSTRVAVTSNILAASLKTGALLWNVSSGIDYAIFSGNTAVADQGKFAVRFNDGHWYCWDQFSGQRLWKSELTSWPWSTFGTYSVQSYGGMLLSNQYDGVVAIDWDTGKPIWHFVMEAPYPYESPYTGPNGETVYSVHHPSIIADGKLYFINAEHSAEQPIRRGWKLHCINVTDGKPIWNFSAAQSGYGSGSRQFQGAIAEGYLAITNSYDGYVYTFGKGKSKTTVAAPLTAVTKGQSIVIQGTVMDMSPAQPGTPCVSKESMGVWMEHLHIQRQIPNDFTVIGVPVSLDAVGPNGNTVNIATVTSDASGTFSYVWEPDMVGKYTIKATFAGDDSYGSSWAETNVAVMEAPPPIEFPEQPILSLQPLEAYIIAATIAIIIAIAIVGVLILRKRP